MPLQLLRRSSACGSQIKAMLRAHGAILELLKCIFSGTVDIHRMGNPLGILLRFFFVPPQCSSSQTRHLRNEAVQRSLFSPQHLRKKQQKKTSDPSRSVKIETRRHIGSTSCCTVFKPPCSGDGSRSGVAVQHACTKTATRSWLHVPGDSVSFLCYWLLLDRVRRGRFSRLPRSLERSPPP